MLVNYKGRPWMRGATENVALLYSLAACFAGVLVAAWEVSPTANEYLGLVPLPEDGTRGRLLNLLLVTLLGSLLWDRLCLCVFAHNIFRAQLADIASLSTSDLWGPRSGPYLGYALAGLAWLYFTEGNMLVLGLAWLMRKRLWSAAPAADAAPAQRVGSAKAAAKNR